MWNPFKKREIPAEEGKLDELIGRIREDLEKHGGFAIIGINGPVVDGHTSMVAGALVRNVPKSQVVYTCIKTLEASEVDVILSMMQYAPSKVFPRSPYQADIKK